MISASQSSERGKLKHTLKRCSGQVEANGEIRDCVGRARSATALCLSFPTQRTACKWHLGESRRAKPDCKHAGRRSRNVPGIRPLGFCTPKFNALPRHNSSDQKQHSQYLAALSQAGSSKQQAAPGPGLCCWGSPGAHVSDHRGFVYKARL